MSHSPDGAEVFGTTSPKPDVPYLVHADNLVATDVTEAKEEKRKQDVAYVVAGASSTAKTPLAGPAFIFQSEQLQPDKLQLYRFDVKNGNREVLVSHKGKTTAKPILLNYNAQGGGLFKIEVDAHLDNGEYCLTPDGSNQVFCFQVY